MSIPNSPRPNTIGTSLRAAWPLLRELIRPRLGSLVGVVVLVAIGRVAAAAVPASTKYLVDDIVLEGRLTMLVPILAGVVTAATVQALAQLVATLRLSAEGLRLVAELRCRLQAHVAHLPCRFHDANQSGALARRVLEEPLALRNLFGSPLIEWLGAVFMAICATGFLARISLPLTLLTVGGIALLIPLSQLGFRRSQTLFRVLVQLMASANGRLVQSIGGIRVVKVYSAEAREAQIFGQFTEQLRAGLLRTTEVSAWSTAAITVAVGVLTGGLAYLATREIGQHQLTIGGMTSFMAFLSLLTIPALQLPRLGFQLAESLAGVARMQELLQEGIEDTPRRTYLSGRLEGRVAFERVSFSYTDNEPVLHDVSLEAEPGATIAIVGASGAGKSTIISLLAGFYEPSAGIVRVDGLDLSTVQLRSYRRHLGIVLQESFLFDGSIAANVALARPGAQASAVREACRLALVDEFVEQLPAKYETIVGERGVRLSMGQRQRISLARAILADPRILILDEATSSLDSHSEAAIQQALASVLKNRTSFIVAHRLSTIQHATRIIVLDKGRLVEQGRHEALCQMKGRYYHLYSRQRRATEGLPRMQSP